MKKAPTPALTQLAKQLRLARTRSGLSQTQAAIAVKCSVTEISRWEKGERAPSVKRLGELCKAYDADAAKLLTAAAKGKIET